MNISVCLYIVIYDTLYFVIYNYFSTLKEYGYFSKKIILIPNVAETNILILVEEKK
jgi:hypothetical protein